MFLFCVGRQGQAGIEARIGDAAGVASAPTPRRGANPVSDPTHVPPIAHIHGPRFPRDPVEIFGTTTGLERLINALIEAVNNGRGRCEILVSDGFESEVRMACLDGDRRAEEWRRSGSPYLDVDDPLVARIIELTDEVDRLRQIVQRLYGNLPAGSRPPG